MGTYIEVPASEYKEFTKEWLKKLVQALRPSGSAYIVSGYTHLHHVLNAIDESGLDLVNHIIWKYNFGVYTTKKFVSSHYHILYCRKPGPRTDIVFNTFARVGSDERTEDGGSLNYLDREDVWVINREYKPGQEKNKNELPSDLLRKMIAYSSNPGDLVCDFFLGGGSTVVEALRCGRRAIGIERSVDTFRHHLPRLAAVPMASDPLTSVKPGAVTGSRNRGAPWAPADLAALGRRFASLRPQMTKAAAVAVLMEEFGRGRLSIEKALKITQPS